MICNGVNLELKNIKLTDKKSFYDAFYKIIQPCEERIERNFSYPSFGSHRAHYDDMSTELESFSRPLWGLAGACKYKDSKKFNSLIVSMNKGLKFGTDKNSEFYWGTSKGYVSQNYVEMAAVAVALSMSPHVFWEPLSQQTKKNIVTWLNTINSSESCVAYNNWRFFRILVNTFLKNANQKYSQKMLNLDFVGIESYYAGNGWYTDGKTEQIDHYIPFAIHFYSLLYCSINPQDEQRCKIYKERARVFAKDFLSWFSAEGPALAFGRSLTYRFAHSSFWVAYVNAEIYKMKDAPVSLGEAKGIIVRNLEYWLKKPIFDNGGILTVGYEYSNLHMTESYNAPGSPYWAVKAFQILALPKNHVFWKISPQKLPVNKENKNQQIPRFIFSRTEQGDITVLNAGQYAGFEPRHHKEKYAKFAYSSHFGFTVSIQNEELRYFSLDNTLGISVDGVHWSHKGGPNVTFVTYFNYIYTQWNIQSMGVGIKTVLIPISGNWHLRCHLIVKKSKKGSKLYLAEGGFSTPYQQKISSLPVRVLSGCATKHLKQNIGVSVLQVKNSPYSSNACALVETDGSENVYQSGIWDLENSSVPYIKQDEVNTNIVSPKSVTPFLYSEMVNKNIFKASLVYCNRMSRENKSINIPKVVINKKLNSIVVDNKKIKIKENIFNLKN